MEQPFSNVILISDMDDTLLMPDKSISSENLDALQEFRALGGRFTVATGRSVPSYMMYHHLLCPDLPVILNNGAVIYDPNQDRILWNTVLPETAVDYVEQTISQFPDAGVEVLTNSEKMYIPNMTPVIQRHVDREHLAYEQAACSGIPLPWFKVLFAVEEDRLALLNQYFAEKNYADVQYINSSKCYCEMLPLGSSKGAAAKVLVQMMGQQQQILCGMGDFYNDLELIRFAQIGIAVENAPEDVKTQADWVVCPNTGHAAAEAVRRLKDRFL